jgi:hypothetical protein
MGQAEVEFEGQRKEPGNTLLAFDGKAHPRPPTRGFQRQRTGRDVLEALAWVRFAPISGTLSKLTSALCQQQTSNGANLAVAKSCLNFRFSSSVALVFTRLV